MHIRDVCGNQAHKSSSRLHVHRKSEGQVLYSMAALTLQFPFRLSTNSCSYNQSILPYIIITPLQLGSNNLGPLLGGEGLGALNRGSNSTVDDQLWEDTNRSGHTEENSVVVGFSQAVVLEKDTGVCVLKKEC